MSLEDYVRYYCRSCNEECINRENSPAARRRHCWRCWRVPAIEEVR